MNRVIEHNQSDIILEIVIPTHLVKTSQMKILQTTGSKTLSNEFGRSTF